MAFALVLSAFLVGTAPSYAEADEPANEPLSCSPGTFYTLTGTGQLAKISSDANGNPIGAVEALPGAFPQTDGWGSAAFNSLGIARGGVAAYALQRGPNSRGDQVSIVKWTVEEGFAKVGNVSGIAGGVVTGAIAGAVSRDGDYYFGGWEGSAFTIYRVDPDATPLAATLVGAVRPDNFSTTNGDFAFDKQGNLFIIFSPTGTGVDNYIFTVTAAALASGNGGTLQSQQLTQRSGQLGSFNGIAFDAAGAVLIQRGGDSATTQFAVVDPNTMVVDSSTVVTAAGLTGSGVDLGSCLYPGTITVRKDYPDGRLTPADQVKLSLERGDGAAQALTATTTGATSGIQDEHVGPSIGLAGQSYTASEAAASGSSLDRYLTSYTVTKNGEQLASGTGAEWELDQFPEPDGAEGPDIVVTFTNAKPTPGFNLSKTADPVSETTVLPGQSITYTVTGSNTGETVLDPVVVTDDLTEVLKYADLQGDPVAKIGDDIATAPVVSDATLTWAGRLDVDQSVTISYTVQVKADASGNLITNRVTGSATPPGLPPITPPPAETEHPVPTPGFDLVKSSDPETGSTVRPGDSVTYTVTGSNTGATVLDPVTISDDLSAVLAAADLQGEPVAKIGDEVVTAPSVEDGTLTWSGTLPAGESVTISYTVEVKADAAGKTLKNVANGSATPPGQPPITPPPAETEHPVPGFDLVKSSDPETGSTVRPGDTVTYTVTGSNSGATALDPVVVTDDLSAVLAAADLQGDPVAKIGDETVAAPSIEDGTLTWTGSLAKGESVTITYSVTVKADAAGKTLHNVVTGSATPPGPNQPPITPPPGETEHHVPGFDLAKSSDPSSGAEVNPGDTVTYTVTGTNTGATVLDPVVVSDDLSAVLAAADLQGDPVAKIGDETVAAPSIEDGTLTWTGSLDKGESVTITYSVTVKADAAGKTLHNVAIGSATPPGPDQPPITPPPGETDHPVPTPGFALAKSSAPETGAEVNPGDTVTYTVTGTNTGATVLDPVVVTDDLSQVLEYASLQGDPVAKIGDAEASAPSVEGAELTWTGSLNKGEVVTITYTVKVNTNAVGRTLKNVVTGSATPPGQPPITPPPGETEHPVPTPGFEFAKSATPATNTEVHPGETVTYTVTGSNTGATVLNPVAVTDDLSEVLAAADLQGDPVAKIGDETVAAPSIEDGTLTWTGSLDKGESVTITYSVTVKADAAGKTLHNVATGTATPPGQPPITPPPGETEHPVPTPGFDLAKSSDPQSGSEVNPGDTVTYTVTGSNTGATVLNPVAVTDDLSEVLAAADLQGDPVAKIGDETVAAPSIEDGTLTWTGSLGKGESVTISYSVTVKADAAGTTLHNVATGSATPPGPDQPPITPPPGETEHPVPTPGFELAKTADPATGSTVQPGDVVTYTVTGANTGETVLDPVVINDDLSEVLAAADLQGDPVARIGDETVAAPSVEDGQLTWTGSLDKGEVVTITYSVQVKADAAGQTLKNVATGSATPPGPDQPPITPPPGETEHPVPGFDLVKSSDPETGSTVQPGDTVTYTVTGANTGATVLDPVVVSDDLSAVLAAADLQGDPVARIGDEVVTAPSVEDGQLTWTGSLDKGEVVTITYSVQVKADAAGQTLKNVATGSATPPGPDQPPITPPPGETEHPVPTPGFEISKTADPVSGSTVNVGQTITYTVSAVNTGETVLDPVVVTDDLSAVLPFADLQGDPVATIGDQAAVAPVVDGSKLTWTGTLEPGQSVVITYQVKVKATAFGKTLKNVVTGEATPPGQPPITPPSSTTEHPVPPKPTPGLPDNGRDAGVGIAAGLVLLLAGASVAAVRRRRERVTLG